MYNIAYMILNAILFFLQMCTRLVKTFLESTVILPLTAGRRRPNKQYADGSIAILIAIFIWLSIMVVLIPGRFNPNGHTNFTTGTFVHFVLDFNIILGILGCATLLARLRKHGYESIAAFSGRSKVLKLRLIFLWIFLLGVLVNCISKMWRGAFCLESYQMLKKHTLSITSALTYDTFLSVFCIIETMLLTMFVGYKLKEGIIATYSILAIIGTNISVWLHAFNKIHKNDLSSNTTSTSNHLNSCYQPNTTQPLKISWFIDKSEAPLLTTELQFSLLSINLLVELWTRPSITLCNEDRIEYELLNETNLIGTNQEENTEDNDDNNRALHRNISESSYGSIESNESPTNIAQCFHLYHISMAMAILIVFAMSIICIIGATPLKSADVVYQGGFRNFLTMYKGLMVIVLYLSFFCIKNSISFVFNKAYTAREKIMFIGILFTFQYNTYKVLAGILAQEKNSLNFIRESCFSFVLEYLQIVLILQLNRMELCNINRTRKSLLKACVGFSMILVLGLWFVDSFIGLKYPGMHKVMQDGVGHNTWRFIKFVIYPVMVFYKFTIFFAYVSLFQAIKT